MSVYVDSTLANMSRRAYYDRSMSRRTRLLLVPAVLLTVVVGSVYALAELHLAKDEVAAAPEPVAGSTAAQGEAVFVDNCAGCHGEGGSGGGIGPTLAGSGTSVDAARTVIENGSGRCRRAPSRARTWRRCSRTSRRSCDEVTAPVTSGGAAGAGAARRPAGTGRRRRRAPGAGRARSSSSPARRT